MRKLPLRLFIASSGFFAFVRLITMATNPITSDRTDCRKYDPKRGHVSPVAPCIPLTGPGRLRTANVLALCGISHSTLYARQRAGTFPKPDGKDGGLNYWNTATIRRYLDRDQSPDSHLQERSNTSALAATTAYGDQLTGRAP